VGELRMLVGMNCGGMLPPDFSLVYGDCVLKDDLPLKYYKQLKDGAVIGICSGVPQPTKIEPESTTQKNIPSFVQLPPAEYQPSRFRFHHSPTLYYNYPYPYTTGTYMSPSPVQYLPSYVFRPTH